jgi:hypothetical protein
MGSMGFSSEPGGRGAKGARSHVVALRQFPSRNDYRPAISTAQQSPVKTSGLLGIQCLVFILVFLHLYLFYNMFASRITISSPLLAQVAGYGRPIEEVFRTLKS